MPHRQNDPEITDDTHLWRAVHVSQVCVAEEGSERAESWAFMSSENEVSAWIATETNIEELRTRFPGCRIAEFTAGQLESVAILSRGTRLKATRLMF
jgi:hypothetical protein